MLLSPTPYTVINTSDDPTVSGSLPWAINQANNQGNAGYGTANSDGSVIGFDVPATDPGYSSGNNSWTITLSSTLKLSESDGPEVIDGPTAGTVIVSGGNAVGVFAVDLSITATISNLTISGGQVAGDGGGIFNLGLLNVSDCTISGDSAVGSGGGIYNNGTLTVTDSTISGDKAADGGGISDENDSDGPGNLMVNGSTFSSDTSEAIFNGESSGSTARAT